LATETLPREQLDAIAQRCAETERQQAKRDMTDRELLLHLALASQDAVDLLAEVDRLYRELLQAEVERIRLLLRLYPS